MGESTYKAIKVSGIKYDYHRWLMEQELGRKLDSNEFVHHIDENKRNNDITNLKVMDRSEHSRMHQTGRSPSETTKAKLSAALRGRPNVSCRKLTDEQVDYIREKYIPYDKKYGATSLAREFNVSHSQISRIANRKCRTNYA